MQKRFPALNLGLMTGIAASLLLHGSLLGVKAFQHPAEAKFDRGDISVELTLVPSIASVAATQPVPPPEEKEEPFIETPEPIPPVIEPETIQPLEATEPPPPQPAQESPEPAIQESVNSVDQDGSLEEDKGSFSQAQTLSQCSPIYPRLSRRRGEEGTVILSIQVLPSGKAGIVKVIDSSGFKRLDEAAVNAARKVTYAPATQFGQPVEDELIQPITFNLTQE